MDKKIYYIFTLSLILNISLLIPDIAQAKSSEGFSSLDIAGLTISAQNDMDDDEDEFEDFDQNQSVETEASGDDEFEDFEEFSDSSSAACPPTGCEGCDSNTSSGEDDGRWDSTFTWLFWVTIFTILSGIFVRFAPTRKLRPVFLIASIVILGFYRGACPCPISSIQNVFLGILGEASPWQLMLWFLSLIPITYLLGKVWCGWICHLGALQEFIYLPNKIKAFSGERSQKIMRYLRRFFVLALLVQLIITRDNLYIHYDPFKVAFNLISANMTGWILLGLVLLTSLFIYRPFCKSFCPIGLVLGWIAKIPGASVLDENGSCKGCKSCSTACRHDAIVRVGKHSVIDNKDCIMCGDCMDSCANKGLLLFRKGKNHNDKNTLERTEDTVDCSIPDCCDNK
ncbi:MAG: 4Fe-4S binding protein [Candidatus Kapabacteria bacterium]|nr:4Fe-4S binding protein [Candidatus Kapabacteria bacterium]